MVGESPDMGMASRARLGGLVFVSQRRVDLMSEILSREEFEAIIIPGRHAHLAGDEELQLYATIEALAEALEISFRMPVSPVTVEDYNANDRLNELHDALKTKGWLS